MNIFLSIIVPFYNAEQVLDTCIESLLKQTINNFEIILVNDCSTDNSLTVAQKYAKKYANIKLISLSNNKGAGSARNHGLSIAVGDYIAFVDADDICSPIMFSTMYDKAILNNADIVVCGFTLIREKIIKNINPQINYSIYDLFNNSDLLSPPWNKIYKASFLKSYNIRFPDSRVSEDMAFAFKALLYKPNIIFIPDSLYTYKRTKYSVTLDMAMRKESIKSIANIRKALHDTNLYKPYRKIYYKYFFLHLIYYPFCLLFIDSFIKGHNRWKNIYNSFGYFRSFIIFILSWNK